MNGQKRNMPPTFFPHETTTRLVLICILLVTWCGASVDVSTQTALDELVEKGMNCKLIPSLALAVVKDGQVMLNKGYGVKTMGTQEPVTSDTLFQTASLTKAFVSALLSHILANDPNRKMSTTLRKSGILPDDFRFNNTLLTNYTTIGDLLAHRTGVPANRFLRLAKDFSAYTLLRKLAYLPSKGGFRHSFYYNDLMYGLAAHLIQVLGHDTWKQQMRDTIFHPTGMSRSTFITDVNFDTDDVATPYVMESDGLQKASVDFIKQWGRNEGSGSIYSSASDMARWMMLMLNDGMDSSGRRVLRQGVVREVLKAASVIPPPSDAASFRRPSLPVTFSEDVYALGWKLGYYRGYQMAYHSGTTYGYRAFLTLLPDKKVGAVTLMSGIDTGYKFRTGLHEYLMDLALGLTPWINESTICTFPGPWRSTTARGPTKSGSLDDDEDVTMSAEDIYGNASKQLNEKRQDTNNKEQSARETIRRLAITPNFDLRPYTGVFHHEAYGDLTVRLNSSENALELEYGIGLWRLKSLGGDHFQGNWLKDYPTITTEFLFASDRQEQIVSVKALTFDKSVPPVFFRSSSGVLMSNVEALVG